jgi:hypothetical protein
VINNSNWDNQFECFLGFDLSFNWKVHNMDWHFNLLLICDFNKLSKSLHQLVFVRHYLDINFFRVVNSGLKILQVLCQLSEVILPILHSISGILVCIKVIPLLTEFNPWQYFIVKFNFILTKKLLDPICDQKLHFLFIVCHFFYRSNFKFTADLQLQVLK